MLSKVTVVRRRPSRSLRSIIIETIFPQSTQQRIVLGLAMICLMSLVVTLTVSAQSKVLLVSTSMIAAAQPPAATRATTASSVGVSTKNAPTAPSQTNVTDNLVRINQLAVAQYANQSEYDEWAYSACSTAAMTEVLNAWWGFQKYRVTDVLAQEVAANAITAQAGLLDDGGIERTMRRFGFVVDSGQQWSLDQLISIAKTTPVIVGFPPAKYDGGHLLVLKGGDGQNVQLADSSRLNMQTISRSQFTAWWGGGAWIAKPSPYSILAKPTMSAARIDQILTAYNSPLAGKGQAIYNILVSYGLDPTIALGFYLHESTMGTAGVAVDTHSWGNLRCVSDANCMNQQGTACQQGQSCYASFSDGIAGLVRWCKLMLSNLYVGDGKVIVDDIISRYAPAADNNNEGGYIGSLKHSTDAWRSGAISV